MNVHALRRTLVSSVLASALLLTPSLSAQATSTWRIAPSAAGLRPCPRPTARPAGPNVTVTEASALCDVVGVRVATLEPAADGHHPDPAPHVLVGADGRYYTKSANSPDRQILVWDRAGNFLRAIGRPGQGPGEFDPRGVNHFLGRGDSLMVADAGGKWSVFGPDFAFVRGFRAPVRYQPESTLATGAGIFSTSLSAPGGASDGSFGVIDWEGAVARRIGPMSSPPGRAVALLGASYWVLPESGGRSGLVLEEWTTTGTRGRTLTRAASWLPASGYAPVAGEPALPEFEAVQSDPDGFLWVRMAVRDPRWRSIEGAAKRTAMAELYDGRVEVIDPVAGVVLATFRIDDPATEMPPFTSLIPGTRRAYREVVDALGSRSIEIFDIYLVGRAP